MRLTYILLLELPSTRAHARQTLATARALAERGHEVHLHPRLHGGAGPWEAVGAGSAELPGLHLHPVRAARDDLGRARVVLRHLREMLLRPSTVLYARERRTLAPLLPLRRALGRRSLLVYEFHNLEHRLALEAGSPRRARRVERAERAVARESDGLLATTEALARDVRRTLEPRGPVEVVPSGADVDAFLGVGEERRRNPPPEGGAPVRLVYAGSLYPDKGVDGLVRAMAHLPERIHLAIVGGNDPPDLARLRALATELAGVGERVHFTGQVAPEEVPGHLAGADFLVVPAGPGAHSLRYTSPLKLFEAMATGVPLVVGPSEAFGEVVRDGRDAFVAPDATPEGLARVVERALSDVAAAREVGRRAMARAVDYGWARRAERIETFIMSLRASSS